MSNKNKAVKSKESKQRTKAANKKVPTRRYTKRSDRADINLVQLAFLRQVLQESNNEFHKQAFLHTKST